MKPTIDIGSIDNATELIFSQANNDHRYILQPKIDGGHYGYTEDYVDFIARFPKHSVKRTNEHYIDDTDGQWYACYHVYCFDPPFAVIRARSMEAAYEVFCDEFSNWLEVDASSEADYHTDECNANEHADCNCDISYNGSGVHIDTDNVQIHPLTLLSVTVG